MKSARLSLWSLFAGAITLAALSYVFWNSSPRCTAGDCRNGTGVRELKGVFRYAGKFRNGRAHGEGEFHYLAGDESYAGEWASGAKHGRGIYRYADGRVYEGEWRHNQRAGRGVLKRADGTIIFEGPWEDDRPLQSP
jgi:hypothetical protein